MSASTNNPLVSPVTRIISHLRTPLYRNGYALTLSSAATSVIGVVYWVVAAHLYPEEIIGLNSAAISAMMFLAGVSELNLMSALIRFIPGAGKGTRRFVTYTYLVSLLIAAAISLIFILRIRAWAPQLSFLGSTPVVSLWFILTTMAWCIFVLQDSVLTGLRLATWVPLENTVFALVKIALMIIFAISLPEIGVFASWSLALIVSLLPTNYFIFRHLIPRHIKTTQNQAQPVVPSQVIHYAAADYLGALFWLVSTTLLPVLVTVLAGATANAHFYLAWTISYSLYLISPNMGSSLIVETSTDQAKLRTYSRRMYVQTARLVVPLAAFLIICAPLVLHLFGNNYAAEGSTLLRLLALSAIPNVVTALYISVARVKRHMRAILITLGSLCALVLTLSYFLLRIVGIQGVGIAWLASQTLIAGIIYFTQFRPLWFVHPDKPLEGSKLNLRAKKSPFSGIFLNPAQYLVNQSIPSLKVLAPLWQPWFSWNSQKRLSQASKLIPVILPEIPIQEGLPSPIDWQVQKVIHTVTDMTVVALGPSGFPPAAALKLPQTHSAVVSAKRQAKVLASLQADSSLGSWRNLLPKLLAEGQVNGQPYLIEHMLPGVGAERVLIIPAARQRMLLAAYAAIRDLHQQTAKSIIVNEETLIRWVDKPLGLIRQIDSSLLSCSRHNRALNQLEENLRQALTGRMITVSWVHGDFVPQNILVSPDGSMLTGIVDWELAQPDDLPILDLLQLLLSTRMAVQRRELGDILLSFLGGAEWTSEEQTLLDRARSDFPGDPISEKTTLLLCWIRHIAANLTKSTRYAHHWLWVAKNIDTVLRSL